MTAVKVVGLWEDVTIKGLTGGNFCGNISATQIYTHDKNSEGERGKRET